MAQSIRRVVYRVTCRRSRSAIARAIAMAASAAIHHRLELGGPQDVEWALDGEGHVHLLQARPLTSSPP
jgi:phosphoenolpyruvate synthase/pyruvate phosphate dikinase